MPQAVLTVIFVRIILADCTSLFITLPVFTLISIPFITFPAILVKPAFEKLILTKSDLMCPSPRVHWYAVSSMDEAELEHQLQRLACYELTHELLVESQIGPVVGTYKHLGYTQIKRMSCSCACLLQSVDSHDVFCAWVAYARSDCT